MPQANPNNLGSRSTPEGDNVSLVCVQGLGFVGAANAVAIASARDEAGRPLFRVVGVDQATELGRERVAAINSGRFPFSTTDNRLAEAANSAVNAGLLTAVTNEYSLGKADVIVVDIGLDVSNRSGDLRLELAPFETAIQSVARQMRPDALVLLESTVPPGTCERIVAPLLRSGLRARGLASDGFSLAYSYERVMPGRAYLESIVHMWRVYAGIDERSADRAENFLTKYIDTVEKPLTRLRNIRSVELAKIIENTYRAVNIAFIDEWEKFSRKIDIDLFDVLDAVRIRPTHSNIRYPGLGVGGYCLSKDPLFGAAAASEIFNLEDVEFPLSLAGHRINEAMPLMSADALSGLFEGGLDGTRILILGASYRQDVGDVRSSASIVLADDLAGRGARVELADPLVDSLENSSLKLHRQLPAPGGFDAVVFAVAHREYLELDIVQWLGQARPLVFDANGVLAADVLSRVRSLGARVAAIGRGEIK